MSETNQIWVPTYFFAGPTPIQPTLLEEVIKICYKFQRLKKKNPHGKITNWNNKIGLNSETASRLQQNKHHPEFIINKKTTKQV